MSLWVPRTAEPKFVCRVVTGEGETCGKLFYEGEEVKFARHAAECARRYEAEIQAASMRNKLPGFLGDDGDFDVEMERWTRETGKSPYGPTAP